MGCHVTMCVSHMTCPGMSHMISYHSLHHMHAYVHTYIHNSVTVTNLHDNLF